MDADFSSGSQAAERHTDLLRAWPGVLLCNAAVYRMVTTGQYRSSLCQTFHAKASGLCLVGAAPCLFEETPSMPQWLTPKTTAQPPRGDVAFHLIPAGHRESGRGKAPRKRDDEDQGTTATQYESNVQSQWDLQPPAAAKPPRASPQHDAKPASAGDGTPDDGGDDSLEALILQGGATDLDEFLQQSETAMDESLSMF